ncbi:hypothetical protein [Aliarcobacter butzleri]|uniref:hypothetical protein n=1 Tax=Aliarcobacter butzleri TaxID=28197 RepID=UPI00263C1EAA|nr:hypothetical protein [Aliarcobacter butzleri]MDN5053831.1 hypothetical protein [Aliarcobacter butzleri]
MSRTFKASVQYDDIIGEVALDNGDDKGLWDFLRDNGINTDVYFPIGLDYYKGSYAGTFKIITVNKTEIELDNFDNIKNYIDSLDTIPVKIFQVEMSLDEYIEKYTKRFSIAMSNISLNGKKIKDIDE